MKVDVVIWRRRTPVNFIAWFLLLLSSWSAQGTRPAGPLGPSDRPEAYFNGSSYIRLSQPISLKQLVGLSFRTCVGGELFSQRVDRYTLHVTALYEQVVVSWARPEQPRREVALAAATLDNRWHWVALRYSAEPPALALQVDRAARLIANLTWNQELLAPPAPDAAAAVLLVGNVFSGCIHEGPQLEFHPTNLQERNVVFGSCPLSTDDCIDRKDVLRMPPKDHCYNEPCMRHGTCISRHDRYECQCTARYTGNNCEVDAGPPCQSAPCLHGGRCAETAAGDWSCTCPTGRHGARCELEDSLDPQCVARPCANNATCTVPPGKDTYHCLCPPGFTGRNCEVDIDECGAAECLNSGRCVDGLGNYTCDCSGTGYTGERCEENVNECVEDPRVCGHGVCYDTYGGFVCACTPGYTGDRCQKVSSCAMGPCGAGGACVEEGTSWRCVCAKGFEPPLCTPAAPSCADLVCPPHSRCRDTRSAGSPTMIAGVMVSKQVVCVCDPGYYGAPGVSPNCSTLESACESGVCLNGATCSAGADHFNCTCAPGYKGVYCEAAAGGKALEPDRCSAQPCAHAVACTDTATGARCECEPGWAGPRCDCACGAGGSCDGGVCVCRAGWGGARCDQPLDCRGAPCPPALDCVEHGGTWGCAPADSCAPAPCHNGTCVSLDQGLYRCVCPPGNNGRNCELDVDECALMPKICNHGVCVNEPGSYQCYCKPGYTGDRCEQDIDECLSGPCRNGGSCRNLENNYDCDCVDGFQGKDCSVNINECESSPCAAGATCVDGVAAYSCVCPPGLSGHNCEVDIDDCESQPCQHNGVCVDALDGYSCDCAGTGHSGPDCEHNIDECAPQPCRNGGTCVDDLNDYRCVCHPGYTGKDCAVDVQDCEPDPCQHGGVCLELSDVSLYADAPRQVGPQPGMVLPARFLLPFSPANASGFECVCVAGTAGARCEVDVDECASGPCAHGQCVDAVGGYSCDCAAGWEGVHCEREVDECARHKPCAHGRCVDRRADYECVCAPSWGGRNCSVPLVGCRAQPCRHNATCLPWLRGETDHRFNCSCTPGYYGTTCEKVTTMSLEKSSYVEVNTSREEGYDISFRFKTTLGNGLLAMGRGLTYFFLELSNGRLNLHSSLLNKWEGVFIGSSLNDSNWQKVFVTINSSHVVLAANEEQTIYPISQNEASNSSVTSFQSTRLGTAGSSYATLTHGPNFFVGCFQDVVVNSQWVLPEPEGEGGVTLVRGVAAGCPRRAQCQPNPCQSGGACEDAWTTFHCTCPRPHLGDTCQYSYTPATFGHEAAPPRSVVTVHVAEAARRAVHAALDISMFVRTRKPTGQIFYLGSGPRYGQNDETLVAASLRAGELLVHLRFNQTPEEYTVGGTRLDNGYMHLIEVVRNSTLVQVKLNGTEYFRKSISISAAKQLDAQVMYLGGPPPPPPAEDEGGAPEELPDVADYFKGVIQDVQISNGVNVTVVEFFPLRAAGLQVPEAFGAVRLPARGVLPGAVSDDACAAKPCLHDAPCTVTWNDFVCACPRGYKGKRCAEVEFCQLQACPTNSHCRNLDAGYECVSNATFDGVNTTLTYRLRVPRVAAQPPPPAALDLAYRSKWGGTLLHAALGDQWFAVAALRGQLAVHWRLGGALPAVRRLRGPEPGLNWLRVRFTLRDQDFGAAFVDEEGRETASFSAPVDVGAWQDLFTRGTITLGGPARPQPDRLEADATAVTQTEPITDVTVFEYTDGEEALADNSLGEYFKGCIGEVHVGGLLLPFFPAEQLFVGAAAALLAAQAQYALEAGAAWGADAGVGCVLCLETDCQHGGRCEDVRHSYACTCPPGFSGDACERDVDECEHHQCQHGATCRDGTAKYTCDCPPGYSGPLCEVDVDECASSPCGPGACVDGPGAFHCECPPGRSPPLCAPPAHCAAQPCAAGHMLRCVDTPPDPPTGNNYTCECLAGWAGPHCDTPTCALEPCQHGTCVTDTEHPYCACAAGWLGPQCAETASSCAAGVCLHGGRCLAPDPLCDCNGTGYSGARCEVDIDECAEGLVSCGPGDCHNLDGGYICKCSSGFCGDECAVLDPCGAEPCRHGGSCLQRCTSHPLYTCLCADGWAGDNCTHQVVSSQPWAGLSAGWRAGLGAGGALLALAGLGAALALAANARRQRATRGTYSPSGQEYCNPRQERLHAALQPPPEERLI